MGSLSTAELAATADISGDESTKRRSTARCTLQAPFAEPLFPRVAQAKIGFIRERFVSRRMGDSSAVPKIDIAAVPQRRGSGYPSPFDSPCATRIRRRLGDAGGLKDFGVNLMTLPPGAWSSQRHWHSHEDEFVYVLEGEVTLVENQGRAVLRAGDCAAFPKGTSNGHHLINESSEVAVYLEIGSRHPDDLTTCSDIDMKSANSDGRFVRKDGTPYA
jgi:uncharacterized cupin superfamily protein